MKKKSLALGLSRGFIHTLLLLLVVTGLVVSLYLVNSKGTLNLFSKAAAPKSSSVTVKIGLVTDTHYSRANFSNRLAVAQGLVSTFNTEGVDLVLGLGDMYDGHFSGLDDYLQDKAQYEVPWVSSKAPVRWVVGNHDIAGISTSDYISNSKYAVRNWIYDLPDNWRIVAYTNVEGSCFSAKSDTLDWLKTALVQARTDNKKVIVANHAHIEKDYPSTATNPRDVVNSVDFTSRVAGTVLTPSSTIGTATVSASLEGTFLSSDVGKPLHLLYGDKWGWGIVASYVDSKTVKVDVKSVYGGTEAAVRAELGGCGGASLNADEQRAIINESVSAGTKVKYVFSGHAHASMQLTVNGVEYYGFQNTGDNGIAAIVTLQDGSIGIAALSNGGSVPRSYNQTTFYVDGANGNDTGSGTSRSQAWRTLNRAAQRPANAGDIVTVMPGTYRESVTFWGGGESGKPVTWIYEPGAKHQCVGKEAGQQGTALQIPNKVSYLTIQGGEFSGCRSNGISIQGEANHIEISGVTSSGNGIGISYASTGGGNHLTKSRFTDNGMGVGIYAGIPTVTYSIAVRNQTGFDVVNASPNIFNVVSFGNQWGFGIGNNSSSPGPVIRNAISQGNTKGGMNSYGSGASSISNSIMVDGGKWGNTTKSNISTADPGFVNPAGDNFNLKPDSPAIDFGVDVGLTSDFAGNSIQGKPDAGAFEYQPQNTSTEIVSTQATQSGNDSSSQASSGGGNPGAPVCTDAKPSGAPKLLSASVSGKNQVSLAWSKAPDPVTYYLVAYGTKSGKLEYGNPNIGGKEITNYIVKGLENGKAYYFRVRAGNNCAPGDFSNEVAAKAVGDNISSGPAVGFKAGVLGTGQTVKQNTKAEPTTSEQPRDIMENLALFLTKILTFLSNIFNLNH